MGKSIIKNLVKEEIMVQPNYLIGLDLFPLPIFRGIGMHISLMGEVERETLS